jgi:hypothetical protein
VKQSNVKSINHDSSEDHGSSPEDPESICGDWEEYTSYTSPDTNDSNQSGDSEAESEPQSPQARRRINSNTKSRGYKRDSPEYSEAESSTSQAKQQNKPQRYKKDSFVPTIASEADLKDA